jgi:hypothetical protein
MDTIIVAILVVILISSAFVIMRFFDRLRGIDRAKQTRPETFSIEKLVNQYRLLGGLTIFNSVLMYMNIGVNFPAGINLGRFIAIEIVKDIDYKINSYVIITFLFGLVLSVLSLFISNLSSAKTRNLTLGVILFYFIDTLSIIYLLNSDSKFGFLIVDLVFHVLILYSSIKLVKNLFYKDTSSNNGVFKLNFLNLPKKFHHLIPEINLLGISDDLERSQVMDSLTEDQKKEIFNKIKPLFQEINDYLDSFKNKIMSEEAMKLQSVTEAAAEIQVELKLH